MDFSTLARYRKHVTVFAFVLFAMGVVGRWHLGRQRKAIANLPAGPARAPDWEADCQTYACPVMGARGELCEEICQEANENGSPKIAAERIAMACRKDCVSREQGALACYRECLVDEARRMIGAENPSQPGKKLP